MLQRDDMDAPVRLKSESFDSSVYRPAKHSPGIGSVSLQHRKHPVSVSGGQ